MNIFLGILTLIAAFFVWKVYHNLFNVAYFGFNSIIKELFVCWIIGVIIVGAIATKIFGYVP